MRNVTARLLREEEGSTTVAAALFIAAFVVLTLVGVTAGVRVVQARQAAVAADLAAVAGAVAAQESDDACKAAGSIAKANHARLVTCEIDGEDVQVSVQSRAGSGGGCCYWPSLSARDTPLSTLIAPALSSGSLPLPHLGDWMHDGQPDSHSQAATASRVARIH